jgi:hypothetical protein
MGLQSRGPQEGLLRPEAGRVASRQRRLAGRRDRRSGRALQARRQRSAWLRSSAWRCWARAVTVNGCCCMVGPPLRLLVARTVGVRPAAARQVKTLDPAAGGTLFPGLSAPYKEWTSIRLGWSASPAVWRAVQAQLVGTGGGLQAAVHT